MANITRKDLDYVLTTFDFVKSSVLTEEERKRITDQVLEFASTLKDIQSLFQGELHEADSADLPYMTVHSYLQHEFIADIEQEDTDEVMYMTVLNLIKLLHDEYDSDDEEDKTTKQMNKTVLTTLRDLLRLLILNK
jgi:hypothetical protein